MRIALVNSNRKSHKDKRYYSVALLKLGAWLKSEGNSCKMFDNVLPKKSEGFDEIWITTIFTYDVFYVKAMIESSKKISGKVVVGGISASLMPDFFRKLGVKVHVGLHPKAENFDPDYSLLEKTPEYSISYTSRGCVRKCGFCMVKNLEPDFKSRDWERDISPLTTKVQFYDNNWLAKKNSDLFRDIEKMKKLVDEKKITEIDFNQALDCRLVTEEIAKALQGLPIFPMRFAFDGMHEDKFYQKAIRLMAKYGFSDFISYYLFNFNDTPQDFYYRLRENVKLQLELKCYVKAFPMRYQPIMDTNTKRNYAGKNWSKKMLTGFMSILNNHSPSGLVNCRSMEEFEYWFGKNDKEFVKMLIYPNIRKLSERKRQNLRLKIGNPIEEKYG